MQTPSLLGRWRLLRAHHSLDFAPEVGMEFEEGGRLHYSFAVGDCRQTIDLVYRIDGKMLHTDNPSTSHETVVQWRIGMGEVLVLDFAGAEACFVRDD